MDFPLNPLKMLSFITGVLMVLLPILAFGDGGGLVSVRGVLRKTLPAVLEKRLNSLFFQRMSFDPLTPQPRAGCWIDSH